jgi:hypothetical protein
VELVELRAEGRDGADHDGRQSASFSGVP